MLSEIIAFLAVSDIFKQDVFSFFFLKQEFDKML